MTKNWKKNLIKKDKLWWLTPKQELFAMEFLIDMNATRAYKTVYKASQKVAETNSSRLLGNAKVVKFLQWKLEKKITKLDIDSERVLETLKELVDRCMQRTPVMIRVGKTIIQKKESYTDPDTWEESEVWVWSFDSAGANSALDKLAKYLKLYTDGINLTQKWNWDIIIKVPTLW